MAKLKHVIAGIGLIALSVMDVAFFSMGPLTNGFWSIDRIQGFHIAYWLGIGCFLFFLGMD